MRLVAASELGEESEAAKLTYTEQHLMRGILLAGLVLAVVGCATSEVLTRTEKPSSLARGTRILLMEPDVQLFELTMGGLLEPRADWTAAARTNVGAALADVVGAMRMVIVPYRAPSDAAREHTHVQLIKLHERVGATILTFRYSGTGGGREPARVLRLPGKGDAFDWTLGEAARTLGEDSGADYALFVRFLDSYASKGRVATMVVGALLGVGVPGGAQVGFGSLVDLKTGDLTWFNRLINVVGDLRTPEPAHEAVKTLLSDFPP